MIVVSDMLQKGKNTHDRKKKSIKGLLVCRTHTHTHVSFSQRTTNYPTLGQWPPPPPRDDTRSPSSVTCNHITEPPPHHAHLFPSSQSPHHYHHHHHHPSTCAPCSFMHTVFPQYSPKPALSHPPFFHACVVFIHRLLTSSVSHSVSQ